jgi:hypothetical protein
MAKNNYIEPDKIMLTRWIDKALNKTLTNKNITSRLRTTKIWPLNLKAMDKKLDRVSYTKPYNASNQKKMQMKLGEKRMLKLQHTFQT